MTHAPPRPPLGVGVIGLGFMGRAHLGAWGAAAEAGIPLRVVAVCDARGEAAALPARAGNLAVGAGDGPLFDPAATRVYREAPACLADEAVHVVSVCTPTDTHVEIAEAALRAGKHVLVEKPVALDVAGVDRIAAAARAEGRLCMPAFCMRFWPGWDWLHDRIADGSLGAVRSLVLRRLASPPDWSPEFYRDAARTGGALFDLHLHDADFVRWCFGDPVSVASAGSADHLTTLYRFRGGPAHVVAEGGWDHAAGFPFRMQFVAVFERATADYDSLREPRLQVHREGRIEPIAIAAGSGYDAEVRHFAEAVLGGGAALRATLDDARAVTELLLREKDALGAR